MVLNSETSSRQHQRGRRRRPGSVPATAAIALVALATSSPSLSPLIVHGAHPPSIKKKTPKRPAKMHQSKIRGSSGRNSNVAADAALAAEGVIRPFNGSGSHTNNGSGGSRRVVIVQPESLQRSTAHVATNYRAQEQSGALGSVELHPWPHPDTFQDNEASSVGQKNQSKQRKKQRDRRRGNGLPADFAGERALYGSHQNHEQGNNVEYYQNGHPLQSSSSTYNQYYDAGEDGNNNDDNVSFEQWLSAQGASNSATENSSNNHRGMSEEQWLQAQSKSVVHVANYMPQQQAQEKAMGLAHGIPLAHTQSPPIQSQQMDYQEWLQNQPSEGNQQQQVQVYGQVDPMDIKSTGTTQSESKLSSPLEDLDVVSGKQVILRPIVGDGIDLKKQKLILPPMGSASSTQSNNNNEGDEPMVYYYDPQTLQSSSLSANTNNNEIVAPELTLPEIVYDSSGRPLKLETLHDGGRNEVFLEIKPKAVWGSDLSNGSWNDKWSSLQEKLQFNPNIGGNDENGASQSSQDQLIVLFTVATMAVMVGALVAQRLRSKKLLESCMHPELDDEDWESDVSPSNSASGRGSARYDKKFDVDTGRSVTSSGTPSSSSGGLNSGFGALMGGRNSASGYYGTNDNGGGGLHWRGDMEKFDV